MKAKEKGRARNCRLPLRSVSGAKEEDAVGGGLRSDRPEPVGRIVGREQRPPLTRRQIGAVLHRNRLANVTEDVEAEIGWGEDRVSQDERPGTGTAGGDQREFRIRRTICRSGVIRVGCAHVVEETDPGSVGGVWLQRTGRDRESPGRAGQCSGQPGIGGTIGSSNVHVDVVGRCSARERIPAEHKRLTWVHDLRRRVVGQVRRAGLREAVRGRQIHHDRLIGGNRLHLETVIARWKCRVVGA